MDGGRVHQAARGRGRALSRAVVVGAGLFGLTGARALAARGWAVRALDPGPVPHPDAASTDVSKAVRADYGADELYTELGERALAAWPEWQAGLQEPVFHRTGILMLTRAPLAERTMERDSFALLTARGHALERLDERAVAARFPAWAGAGHVDGYYNPDAGWVASGRAVAHEAERCRAAGVELLEATMAGLIERGGRVSGVTTTGGAHHEADLVLVAAGAWTPALLPHLADRLWATAQPVVHLAPSDPAPFRAERFPVWASDVTETGWYGFPVLPDGRLKIANHGPGRRVDPRAPRAVLPAERERARAFAAASWAAAAEAPVAHERVCLYCDSFDGDFWIDRDPERPGLAVAAGGSGHAFKFLPLLGELVADACEGRLAERTARWRWRSAGGAPADAMRSRGAK